jgi:hypothetical protein
MIAIKHLRSEFEAVAVVKKAKTRYQSQYKKIAWQCGLNGLEVSVSLLWPRGVFSVAGLR